MVRGRCPLPGAPWAPAPFLAPRQRQPERGGRRVLPEPSPAVTGCTGGSVHGPQSMSPHRPMAVGRRCRRCGVSMPTQQGRSAGARREAAALSPEGPLGAPERRGGHATPVRGTQRGRDASPTAPWGDAPCAPHSHRDAPQPSQCPMAIPMTHNHSGAPWPSQSPTALVCPTDAQCPTATPMHQSHPGAPRPLCPPQPLPCCGSSRAVGLHWAEGLRPGTYRAAAGGTRGPLSAVTALGGGIPLMPPERGDVSVAAGAAVRIDAGGGQRCH